MSTATSTASARSIVATERLTGAIGLLRQATALPTPAAELNRNGNQTKAGSVLLARPAPQRARRAVGVGVRVVRDLPLVVPERARPPVMSGRGLRPEMLAPDRQRARHLVRGMPHRETLAVRVRRPGKHPLPLLTAHPPA